VLNIYTRHSADCAHSDNSQWRRCRCPKWLRGVLPNGATVRESAGTRSWEQAERVARQKEAEADPTRVDEQKTRRTSVKDAIRMCLEDEEARGLEVSSRKKSRTILERQFLPFCEARKFVHLDQILPIDLTEFRSSWNNGEATNGICNTWPLPCHGVAISLSYRWQGRYKLEKPAKPALFAARMRQTFPSGARG